MPATKTIANRIAAAFTSPTDVTTALQKRRQDALRAWQDMVKASAAGEAIDLDQLGQVGYILRLPDTAKAFASDVGAVEDVARLEVEAAAAVADAQQAAGQHAKVVADLEDARAVVAHLENQLGAFRWRAESAGHARGHVRRAMETAPRIYGAELLVASRPPHAPAPTPAEVLEHAIAAPVADDGEAFFED